MVKQVIDLFPLKAPATSGPTILHPLLQPFAGLLCFILHLSATCHLLRDIACDQTVTHTYQSVSNELLSVAGKMVYLPGEGGEC